ncbi:uncharacterized protein LOC118280829 [Spodoptera frugiperda]|uniref:Uncharacterized protein LOC118280829 n=1 Tax=Spodoptera frugiperda TaxID=7108 RepID=A0A9R0DJM3_SPOFR|nr:uncharacterized protein LOC118280829 [Spodoptera frugiperda]
MALLILLGTLVFALNCNAVLGENLNWLNRYFDSSPSAYSDEDREPEHSILRADEPTDSSDNNDIKTLFSNPKHGEERDAEEFLSEMLRVLQQYFARKLPQDKLMNKSAFGEKQKDKQNIAWSYYDDVGK